MQDGNPNGGGNWGRPILGGGSPFDVTKSTLKATAPVFVPRQQFIPPQQPQMPVFQPQVPVQAPGPLYSFDSQGSAIDRLRAAISILNPNPSVYDSVAPPLTQSLYNSIRTEHDLHSVVGELFRQSVGEVNFRYTGAKLCQHLSHHLSIEFNGVNFRRALLTRCQDDHHRRNELMSNPRLREHVFGFTLFMSELLLAFLELKDTQPVPILCPAIRDMVLDFLDAREDPCLTCVVQVLKLTGQILEDTEKEENAGKTEQLDLVFEKIKQILLEENLSRSLKARLLCVVELRAKEWGRLDERNGTKQPNPYLNMPPPETNPVDGFQFAAPGQPPFNFFGEQNLQFLPPQGAPFVDGGDAFYGNNQQGNFYDYYNNMGPEGDYTQFAQDEEFNDEIAAAFDEFMRETEGNYN